MLSFCLFFELLLLILILFTVILSVLSLARIVASLQLKMELPLLGLRMPYQNGKATMDITSRFTAQVFHLTLLNMEPKTNYILAVVTILRHLKY